MTIEISYTSPDTYPVYSPPNYRAGSFLSVTCMASGHTGSISYRWSRGSCSHSYCFSPWGINSWSSVLTYNYAGVYVCKVTDELGNNGSSNSITINIIGEVILHTLIFMLMMCFVQVLGYMLIMHSVVMLVHQLDYKEHSHQTVLQWS